MDENQFPIYERVRKNISYYLGNEEQTTKLSEATDILFDRDYRGKKQIFAPDIFITKDPSMIFTEKDELEKSLVNPDISELEKGKWRTRLNTISGKKNPPNSPSLPAPKQLFALAFLGITRTGGTF